MRIAAATLIVALGGFAVMVLEIIGARYLAKDFGSAFYVWVSQIGVILGALALGYGFGGALADKIGRLAWLAWLLIPAGVFTFLIPSFEPPLVNAIIQRHPADVPIPPLWQKLDPALGSALVFFLPCAVLAMLSPYLIRVASQHLGHVGRISGFIYAASTVGSIAGVFLSGYVLIEQMTITSIFRGTGVLTMFLGGLCWLMDRWFAVEKGTRTGVSPLLIVGVLALAGLGARADVIFDTTSVYHHIQVEDTANERTLRFDNSIESRVSLKNPLEGHFEYTEMFHMSWLWYGKITNILMVGLGGATTQRTFEHDYPGVQIDTVELDPAVLRVAKEFFFFQESPRQRVALEDGRVYLRRSQKQFDAIFMDAYSQNRYGAFIPQHLVTKEFFALAASHLKTNGVLAYNVMGTLDGWQSELLGAMYRTMKTVFPQVYLFPCRTSLNVVLIATKSAERTDMNILSQRADFLIGQRRVTLPTFRTRLQAFRPTPPPTSARAPLLTDDFAPVESLLGIGRQN